MRTSVVSTGDVSHEKMEDQMNTWSSISTRKKMVRSGTQTTTKSAILAGSSIIELPAFYMTNTALPITCGSRFLISRLPNLRAGHTMHIIKSKCQDSTTIAKIHDCISS